MRISGLRWDWIRNKLRHQQEMKIGCPSGDSRCSFPCFKERWRRQKEDSLNSSPCVCMALGEEQELLLVFQASAIAAAMGKRFVNYVDSR